MAVPRRLADMWFEHAPKALWLNFRLDGTPRDPNRYLLRPKVRTSEYGRGAPRKQAPFDVNAQLYEKFKLYVARHGGGLTVSAAIDAYMAWVMGLDCPDSPFLTAKGKDDLKQIAEEADLPRYWRNPETESANDTPDSSIA